MDRNILCQEAIRKQPDAKMSEAKIKNRRKARNRKRNWDLLPAKIGNLKITLTGLLLNLFYSLLVFCHIYMATCKYLIWEF